MSLLTNTIDTQSKTTTITYNLPESCTIFMVFEIFDENGIICFGDDNKFFYLQNIVYTVGKIQLTAKTINLRQKYLIVFLIEKRELIGVLMSHKEKPDFRMLWNNRKFKFNKIIFGIVTGILYELIVYNGIMKINDELHKKVSFFKKIHKVHVVSLLVN